MIVVQGIVLAVLFLLELGALISFGYWGFQLGHGGIAKIALGIGMPLIVAVFWGTFVAPKAAIPVSIPVRIMLQLLVFGSAAAALYASGHPKLAAAFFVIALIELTLNYTMKL
jgi:hypothetical protein